MAERRIEFTKKDFVFKRELGQGACGRTVLLYDSVIDEYFVCKKYSPLQDDLREVLFSNFIQEIKLLHLLNHSNIVRVYNYYLYPKLSLGFIIMEYIQGVNIQEYLVERPEDINEIFVQVIEGFSHLEKNKILHRDIRPQNIMVNEGNVKIIDFGFGKQATNSNDFEKSITLNWWCDPPSEFDNRIYNYQTEVYFVGKLFEKLIDENNLEHFKHGALMSRMCASVPSDRVVSFSEVRKELLSDKFLDIGFENWELKAYRNFSNSLYNALAKIEIETEYHDDIEQIQVGLENCYRNVMLEKTLQPSSVLACFLPGINYYFRSYPSFQVDTLRAFVNLLRSVSREKKNIILSNIQTKLDSVTRYDKSDEDIPF